MKTTFNVNGQSMNENPWLSRLPSWSVYVFAVVVTLLTLMVRTQLDVAFDQRTMLILFMLSIILSAYFGGLWPGLLATLTAALSADYFLIPPIHSFQIAAFHDLVQWLILIVSGILVSGLTESLRSTRQRIKQSADELRGREKRFSILIENGLDEISLLTADGILVWESPSAIRTLGYPENAFLNQNIFQIMHLDDMEWVRQQWIDAVQEPGSRKSGVFRLKHADGSWRWVEAIVTNMLEEPAIKAMVINYRDITERKLSEKKLQESEEHLRALIENGNDVILVLDSKGVPNYISPNMTRLFGYLPHDLREKRLTDFIHPDDVPSALKAIANRMRTPGVTEKPAEFRIRHKDGSWHVMEVIGNNLLDNPAVNGIVLNARDITERKQAEDESRSQKELFQTIVDNIPAMIVFIDADGHTKWVNNHWTDTLGWSMEEAVTNSNLLSEMYPDSLDYQNVMDFSKVGDGKWQDFRTHTKDGRLIDTSWANVLLSDGTSIGIGKDITERKQVEAAIAANQKRFQALIEHAPDGIALLGLDGKLRQVTPSVKEILGYPADDVEGQDPAQVTHPDDLPNLLASLNDLISNPGKVIRTQYRMKHADGSWRWLESTISNLVTEPSIQAIIFNYTDITERKKAEEKIRRQVNFLTSLKEIDNIIISSFDMRFSLNLLLSRAVSLLNADAAVVLLLNPFQNILEYSVGHGFWTKGIQTTHVRLGENHAGRAALERRMMKIPNLDSELHTQPFTNFIKEEKFVSYYGVPLIVKGKVIGVLEVYNRSNAERDGEWLDSLTTLAEQAAIAIDNARLFDSVQQSNMELTTAYNATIEGWSHAMDLRDKETEGHAQRVTDLTLKLAEKLGVNRQEWIHIQRGALLHDIGKLGIPDHILHKPDKLTEDEWAIIRQHPKFAYDLLSPIQYLSPAIDIPYCHHENWDGTGYPRGLKAEQIPLNARIFAIANVWDAITHNRPYRSAWPKEKAIEFIREQSGKQFDPQIVNIFLNLIVSK